MATILVHQWPNGIIDLWKAAQAAGFTDFAFHPNNTLWAQAPHTSPDEDRVQVIMNLKSLQDKLYAVALLAKKIKPRLNGSVDVDIETRPYYLFAPDDDEARKLAMDMALQQFRPIHGWSGQVGQVVEIDTSVLVEWLEERQMDRDKETETK